MRIGLLIYGALETVSGGYLYDRKMIEHLRARGDQVEVVSLPWRNYAQHLADNLSRPLLKRLEALDVDILLQDELNHPSLFWINRRLRGHVPYSIVSIVHHLRAGETHPLRYRALYRAIERIYLQNVDGFIYNSQTTRRSVHRLLAQNGQALVPEVVAYPAADHLESPTTNEVDARIQSRRRATDPLHILFVGNLIERKGLHDLLAALAQLPKKGWELTVVGSQDVDPQYANRVRQLAIEREISSAIQWMGRISDAKLRDCYKRSHLLVVPSYEGFGIVYLEAMSFGLPVIASTAGAAHEIVSHDENGFLTEPGAVTMLADRIDLLQRDRELLQRMSLAARRRFDEQPTWAQSAEKVYQWLHGNW